MKTISLEELLEAGCHFGHQVSRQNPKAREFIFEVRDGIHIIDLEKTKEGLEDAGKFVRDLAKKGGTILVLGTKRQAETILKEEMSRLDAASSEGLYFVTKRWIGGTLTNFSEVAKNFKRLKDTSERLQNKQERASYTKKEISEWEKERVKLESFYGGIAQMTKTPDALFIIDTHQERAAAEEALKMGTPTVGITDTNSDPMIINYPIPANDDAAGSLKLIISYVFDAWMEGKKAKGVDDAKAAESKEKEEKAAAAKAQKESDVAKKKNDFFGVNETKASEKKEAVKKEPAKDKAPKKEESKKSK
jgi:small subunit ribosomal protein S2